jgi:hypothetical protein
MNKNILNGSAVLFFGILLVSMMACNVSASVLTVPTATVPPSSIPASATSAPLLSQQLTMALQPVNESNENPPFTISAQIPQLTGSDDPRVSAFNQRLKDLVTKEVDVWRENFKQITLVSNGSTLDGIPNLVSQIGDLWSFKFDFRFYADGAAHPGLYSLTLNYDLGQGRELTLDDLFVPGSNYLEVIANYCIAELSKQPGFDGLFADGANPKPENYKNWNITPDGLLITFDMYQVAPGASGPIQVLVPYSQLQSALNPQGVLAGFIR